VLCRLLSIQINSICKLLFYIEKIIDLLAYYTICCDRLCGLALRVPGYRSKFLALPDFLRSSGSGTWSTNLLSTTEELLGRKSSGSGLENREYGLRDPSL
jgi:hypothetical protein